MTGLYTSRHFGVSVFLRFALGDDAHVSTTAKGAPQFTFADEPEGRCRELSEQFFGPESVTVGNARELLEVSRTLRATVAKAQESPDQTWRNE